jgi:acyl carrier protein
MSVAEEVRTIIRQAAPERCRGIELSDGVELIAQLGLPSIELIRVFSMVERHFDIDIFDDRFSADQVATVGALVALVQARCAERR